jgi:hypothetical protein
VELFSFPETFSSISTQDGLTKRITVMLGLP